MFKFGRIVSQVLLVISFLELVPGFAGQNEESNDSGKGSHGPVLWMRSSEGIERMETGRLNPLLLFLPFQIIFFVATLAVFAVIVGGWVFIVGPAIVGQISGRSGRAKWALSPLTTAPTDKGTESGRLAGDVLDSDKCVGKMCHLLERNKT